MAAGPGSTRRGRLKVYLGFAAGVGKTYAMLGDAHRAREAGADVVAGYVEPHARPETSALLEGLEAVPPRRDERGTANLLDMDVDAVLRRSAAIVLVDELAHTNLPGGRHRKRFEDVDEILAGGSDVWTTLNVQHLESLNDQLAAITHVRQRETIPDAVLAGADEIVVVDLPPEELRERIRQGKVYPLDRVDAALHGFFRVERLTELRELALRELAHAIEERRVAEVGGSDSPLAPEVAAVGDHLLVLAAGRPGDDRLARRGWRLARRLQCDVEVLHVRQGGTRPDLRELQQVCVMLGLPLRVEAALPGSHGMGQAVARYASAHRVTHVIAGAARDRRLPWRGSTLQEIMDALPWVDFTIVGDPARRRGGEEAAP